MHGTFAGEVGLIGVSLLLFYAWDFRSKLVANALEFICTVHYDNHHSRSSMYRWLPRIMHGTSVPGAMVYALSIFIGRSLSSRLFLVFEREGQPCCSQQYESDYIKGRSTHGFCWAFDDCKQ